ncbi:MAG TPA: hypothetical protein VMR49_00390 [Candidatus Paceibacterota bacterium]|nr:hypothetical protein [Candidatus Paceibacterota bacterium]
MAEILEQIEIISSENKNNEEGKKDKYQFSKKNKLLTLYLKSQKEPILFNLRNEKEIKTARSCIGNMYAFFQISKEFYEELTSKL